MGVDGQITEVAIFAASAKPCLNAELSRGQTLDHVEFCRRPSAFGSLKHSPEAQFDFRYDDNGFDFRANRGELEKVPTGGT